MHWTWSKRSFAAGCAVVILGLVPLAWVLSWFFIGNVGPVSMRIPLQQGSYKSPWFTTRIHDLYELDLGTTPWRHNPVDLNWRIVDSHENTVAAGSWRDQTSGTISVTLFRYYPRPGLRQRLIVSLPHSIAGSEPSPTVSISCPEASLEYSYAAPAALWWAIVLLGLAAVMFFPYIFGLGQIRSTFGRGD
jgi:hypothetical protein